MIYCVGSRTSPYCIRLRKIRSRMRVGLLPSMVLRLTPVLVLSRIIPFSFGTPECTALKMTNVATASVFHILLNVKPIIYEKPNLVPRFKSISIIRYYLLVLSILNISLYNYPLYCRARIQSIF